MAANEQIFQVGDKVVRVDPALSHIVGIIDQIREETSLKQDSSGDDVMIFVKWETGTYSCVSPKFIRKVVDEEDVR